MKIRNLILNIITFSSIYLSAQKTEVKISPDIKERGAAFQGHLTSDESGHYIYLYKMTASLIGAPKVKELIIKKFDPKFKEIYNKSFETDSKNVFSHGMILFNNNFLWLTSERNSKEDFVSYRFAAIDKTGKPIKTVGLGKFDYESKRDIPKTEFIYSEDSSKFAFLAYEDRNKDDENIEVFTSVVNKDLAKDWSKKTSLKVTQELFELLSFCLDNNGNLYLLGKIYEKKSGKESKRDKSKNKVPAYDIKLYKINSSTQALTEYRIALEKDFLRYGSLHIKPNGDLYCIGFYSNVAGGVIQGVINMTLNGQNGTVSNTNKREFSSSDLELFGDRNTDKDKGDEGLDAKFVFRNVLFREDGSTSISAEESYDYEVCTSNGNTITCRTYYVSNDIVVFQSDTSGKITKLNLIPKRQTSTTTSYESFASLSHSSGTLFFYNDDEDNLEKPLTAKPRRISSFKDCVAVMSTVSTDGKIIRKKLFDREDTKSLFMPTLSSKISDNQLFFAASKYSLLGGSEFRIGTITIK